MIKFKIEEIFKQVDFVVLTELFVALMGGVLLTLSLFDVYFHIYPFTQVQSYFVLKVLFLNAPHVGMTYSMLLFLPELREWGEIPYVKTKVMRYSILLFISILAIKFLVLRPMIFGVPWLIKFGNYLNFLLIPLPFLHIAFQFRGIETSLSFKLNSKSQDKIKRGFFYAVLICVLWSSYNSALNINEMKVPFIVGILLCLLLFLSTNFLSREIHLYRLVFSLRYFLFVLAPFSGFAFWGLALCHGVEYLAVYLRMSKNSEIKKEDRVKFHFVSTLFGLLLIFFSSPFWLAEEKNFSTMMALMVSLYMGFLYVHFYLDRQMFKMRDPEVKRLVGKIYP